MSDSKTHPWNPVVGEAVIYKDGSTGFITGIRTDKDYNVLIRTKETPSSKYREGVAGVDLKPYVINVVLDV